MLPFDIDAEYEKRHLTQISTPVDLFQSEFFKTVNLCRSHPKFFANQFLNLVGSRTKTFEGKYKRPADINWLDAQIEELSKMKPILPL